MNTILLVSFNVPHPFLIPPCPERLWGPPSLLSNGY